MKSYVMTDVGLRRASNQDAFCRAVLPSGVEFVVLCDGMGGHRGGNVASEIAVRIFYEQLSQRLEPGMKTKELKSLLESVVLRVSDSIAAVARENEPLSGMGSTVVLAVKCGKKICVAHVGDSRAYLFRNGKLRRLTKDHSLVQMMIDRGEITPEEGQTHPHRNVITRSLGYSEDSQPEILFSDLRSGDQFLLCTDGLSGLVWDEDLAEILRETPPEEAVPRLVEKALEAGGSDNVTVGMMYEEEREVQR